MSGSAIFILKSLVPYCSNYTMKDDFIEIPGHPGYKVNSEGLVMSLRQTKPKILKQGRVPRGYMYVNLQLPEGGAVTKNVHRLVAEAFIPVIAGRTVVDHIDGNPSNNNVENLRWVTQGENLRYAHERIIRMGFRVDRCSTPVRAISPKDGSFYDFESLSTAIRWLHANGHFGGRPLPNVSGATSNIKRVAGNPSKKAYGFRWEPLDRASTPTLKTQPVTPITEETVMRLQQALAEARARIVFLEKTLPELVKAGLPLAT
jgi:hypothetical protein